jgi:hypothetical protein
MQRIPKLQAVAVLALALLFVVSMPVVAEEIKGSLTSIAPDDFVFTMRDDQGTEQTFRLRVDGKVMINAEERSLGELQAGDEVTVTFAFDDKDMVAELVQCKRD